DTLEALGYAEEQCGNRPNAITRYHAALVYMDRGFQPLRYANTLRILAQLYQESRVWDHCQKALAEALDLELAMQPRDEARIAETYRRMADAYRAEGHLEKAATAYKKMATYANLSQEEAHKLRSTLDELERHRATLRAAQESLLVLERTGAEAKDVAFVMALAVKTHFLLSEVDQSRAMMEKLIRLLSASGYGLQDERAEVRALAHLWHAVQYEAQGDRARARDHYRSAQKDNKDTAIGWIITQGLETVS
ncbi:MAG: hypothetical protein HC915_15650, partial [Anaerolineae bacterium]|nr:hypothetical protein [Anaerolineae bacterium]